MFDLVVPVYNSLHHARSCIRSVLQHSSQPFHLTIVDDGSAQHVSAELQKFARDDRVKLLINDLNRGYLYSANRGASSGANPYIVFINSDTVVPPNYLERVLDAFASAPEVSVVSAVSNWANWTRVCWSIPPGHNIFSINELLAKVSPQPVVDINNASGFFFAVRREVFEALNGFDPVYGAGYWEEADFCMKVLNAGKRVVVDEGLFVYHHGWGTFQQTGRNENMERNKKIFMSRWGEKYRELEANWRSNNPISFMEREVLEDKARYPSVFSWPKVDSDRTSLVAQEIETLKLASSQPVAHRPSLKSNEMKRPRVIYVLPAVKVYGGIISVLQVVNQLILNGIDANVCTWGEIDEEALKLFPMFFRPRSFSSVKELVDNFPECDMVVATSWDSVYPAYLLQSRRPKLQACYFVQDYEPDFYTGAHPHLEAAAKRTYSMITDKIVKTRWLHRKIKAFPGRVHRIPLGLNLDFFSSTNLRRGQQILALGRPQSKRRNFDMVVAVYQAIHERHPEVTLALYGFGYDAKKLPFPCKDYGLLTSMSGVAQALNESSILLDCSTFQGFGRPGLEAMACGTFAILTREGGITQYAKHDYNCVLIDPKSKDAILNAIYRFLEAPSRFEKHIQNGLRTADEYSLEREGTRTANLLRAILANQATSDFDPEHLEQAL